MLKSLEMFGFKSFADRTRFELAAGTTCIVGPNGSGKSNVVDAVKWLLGDQSAKSLRGKEMTDVIFNGAANRAPAGFAEAMLSFDNSSGILAIDADEVQIGRRLYRSGESEYLINGVTARLKDIKNLFMGSGVGTTAYAIIEQGRVDQLLQVANVSRRAVFEEAAGISRFKSRKIEAQRKLERVDQNLLRLTDIVDELDGRLNSMRSQAEKAARYREFSEELKSLRIGSAADDYREIQIGLGAIDQHAQSTQAKIDSVATGAAEIEQKRAGLEDELTQLENQLHSLQRLAAENGEQIASHQTTLRHQRSRSTELGGELERLDKQQRLLAKRVREADVELQGTAESYRAFERDFAQRTADVAALETEIGLCSGELVTQRNSLNANQEQRVDFRNNKTVLEGRIVAHAEEAEKLEQEMSRVRGEIANLDRAHEAGITELSRRDCRVQETLAELDEERRKSDELQEQIEFTASRRAGLQHHLSEARQQQSGWEARLKVLEDLEQRQEGVGVGVREILERARRSKIAPRYSIAIAGQGRLPTQQLVGIGRHD